MNWWPFHSKKKPEAYEGRRRPTTSEHQLTPLNGPDAPKLAPPLLPSNQGHSEPTNDVVPTERRMDVLNEICLGHRVLMTSEIEDQWLTEWIDQIKTEGEKAIVEVADLLAELLRCRATRGVDVVLKLAARLQPHPKLVEVVQNILSAEPIIAGSVGRFRPALAGAGRIGWGEKSKSSVVLPEVHSPIGTLTPIATWRASSKFSGNKW